MAESYPAYLAGDWIRTEDPLTVRNPFNDEPVGDTYCLDADRVEVAIDATHRAAEPMRKLSVHARARILRHMAQRVDEARDELARLIALEAGKPLKAARTEVDRAVLTFRTSAEEAGRIQGESFPMDWDEAGEGRFGMVKRVPVGPILAITPFNFPLNLVAHKLAPAVAAGNPIVIKPSERTPLSALALARLLDQTELPDGALSVINVRPELYDALITDERFRMMTFTGSADVGWTLKRQTAAPHVALELGGNAGVIVDADADVEHAAARIAGGGFSFAGQSCISVQRVYVHQDQIEILRNRLLERAGKLSWGDPLDESTDLGPMITPEAAVHTREWIDEAVQAGADVLIGGEMTLDGRGVQPTVLANVDPSAKVCREEVFAPLVVLTPFSDVEEAIDELNDSAYGLQAGIFTNQLGHAMCAFDELEVGGVLVNDVPTWRIDPMPYGGVKNSGVGREGPKYAVEAMTERRLMVINRLS
ncbi:MAG: aldehyde dehydrogenase family protein [Candidatus Bipolaricaulia bacterium]